MYIDELALDKDWCVIEDIFDVERIRHNESVMALGTGFMTTRSSFDEGFFDDEQNLTYDRMAMNVSLEVVPTCKSRWGTFIPLVQGKHPFWNVGIVNLPYYLGLEIYADGEKLNMEQCRISGYKRWLDMKTATLYRSFVWETVKGKKLDVLFTRFMNPDDRFLCVQHVKIRLLGESSKPSVGADFVSARIKVKSYIDNDVRTNGYDKFVSRKVGSCGDGSTIYSDVTANLDDRIVTLSRLLCGKCTPDLQACVGADLVSDRPAPSIHAPTYTPTPNDRRIDTCTEFNIKANEEAEIFKISAQIADVYFDRSGLLENGKKLIDEAMAKGFETLHKAHIERWAKNWEMSDIQIKTTGEEKDYNSQRTIRQAIYHLFRARSTDPRALNCAKGTTSEMYLGSVCWDMEIFFQPFYIYTQPELAKMTHLYRYKMLDGARRSAKSMNYPGARYPWQTDRCGDEVCSLFEYADHEIHITADIVVGLWHYYLNTLDKDYLYNQGLEIIIETARYWAARACQIKRRPGWHINGVMGPDEYKPITNNNAYTNFVVKEALRLVERVVEMIKADDPARFAKTRAKLGFQESEIELYLEIADGLPIPKDEERHIIWQCDDFDTAYQELDIDGIWKDRTKLFGFYTTQELRYRSKCLKQSDVIALMGVYTEAFSTQEMEASYNYYTPYTIHDSSNSICHNTIVAARLGWTDVAYENWKASMDIDFGERPRSSEGVHFANVGGMWQQIVHGFAGMANALGAGGMGTETLTFNPCLPKQFESISFQIIWKGQKAEITVTHDDVTVRNLSDKELKYCVNGEEYIA